jgi:hypothetical protein
MQIAVIAVMANNMKKKKKKKKVWREIHGRNVFALSLCDNQFYDGSRDAPERGEWSGTMKWRECNCHSVP